MRKHNWHRLHQFAIGLAMLFQIESAEAYLFRYYLPTQLDGEIQVLNKSDQDLIFWIGHPAIQNPQTGETVYEQIHGIMGNSKRRFSLSSLQKHAFVQVKVHDEDRDFLIVKLRRPDGSLIDLMNGRAERFSSSRPAGMNELLVTNFSELNQKVSLLSFDRPGIGSTQRQSYQLSGQGYLRLFIPNDVQSVEVNGELPLTAFWVNKDGFVPLNPMPAASSGTSPPEGVQFLLVDSTRNESFIVNLTDPKHIEEARRQIRRPSGQDPSILFGLPDYGSASINKNGIHPHGAAWSWHVKKVFGFGQLGSDSCNGTPSLVEDFLSQWISSERPICFRDYKVTREL